MTTVDSLNHTVHETQTWLKELKEVGHFNTESQAYSALRAVLHALRDRLTMEEAVNMAGQLPMLVRGFYFEGWKPTKVPHKEEKTQQDFFAHVKEQLKGNETIDPAHATRSVFQFLSNKLTPGLIDHVKHMLPKPLQDLWPA